MFTMKHAALLLLLLPASAWATEPRAPAPGASSPAASSAQPAESLPLALSDARCDMVARSTATSWYQATLCAERHKKLRQQERIIKNMIASTYPGFHAAITLPPYSAAGKETIDNLPYPPDSNPMLDENSCKLDFRILMGTVRNAETRQAILQCWEDPHSSAQDKSPAPLNGKICRAAAEYMAAAWYRAGMCTARNQGLASREAGIKEQITATYPAFHAAITTPPFSDAGKYMVTRSPLKPDSAPSLSAADCEANLGFLTMPLTDTGWKQVVQQCWDKPAGTITSASQAPAAR